MKKRQTIKNYLQETHRFIERMLVATVTLGILAVLLIGKLFYLQIIQKDLYTTLSRQNQFNLIPIEPNRGLIYDRNGVLLAENIPVYSLEVTPERVKNLRKTIEELEKFISIAPSDMQEFQKALKQRRPFSGIPLKIKLTDQEVARFSVDQYRFPGVTVNAHLMRSYPLGSALTSVLGYVGRINEQDLQNIDTANYSGSNYIGKLGAEKFFENQLHGTVGYQQVEIDASGRIVRRVKTIPTIPGETLYLTIDSNLQLAAEKALGDISGAVVVLQPNTGQILALVSNPGYDPNLFVNGVSAEDYKVLQNAPGKPLYNRAIRGQFPMGSTIKPFMAITGLDDGIITPTSSIFDPGSFRLAGSSHVYHDWVPHGHGVVNVTKAIIVSCDTFMFTIGTKLGIDAIDNMLSQFGFGQRTGVEMEEELPGLLPTPNWKLHTHGAPWFAGDTVVASIGQGYMLATPIQLAQAVAIIAERGGRFKPTLLLQVKKPDGTITKQQPLIQQSVTLKDNQTWNLITNAMANVVSSPSGTAYAYFQGIPYTLAGKTGTSQVYHNDKIGKVDQSTLPYELRNHSLFIAFGPVDKPQIAIAVVAEHTLVPAKVIARKVLDYYFTTQHHDITESHNHE